MGRHLCQAEPAGDLLEMPGVGAVLPLFYAGVELASLLSGVPPDG